MLVLIVHSITGEPSVWRWASAHRLLGVAIDVCRRACGLDFCGRRAPGDERAARARVRPDTCRPFGRHTYNATMANSAQSRTQRNGGPPIAQWKTRLKMAPVSTTKKAAKTNKAISTVAILIMVQCSHINTVMPV
jgi:hypothetical protein